MSDVNVLDMHIDMCIKYWNGEITEEEFENGRVLHVSKNVDNEMQKDSFY